MPERRRPLAQDAEKGAQQDRSCPAGERKQGSVKRHPTIISTTVLVALICATAPQVALAGSLLSGYGGPGEGSQALIGATLVNGARGGGGGSGGSGSAGGGRPSLAEPATPPASTRTDGAGDSQATPSSGGGSSRQSKRSSTQGANRSSAAGSGASAAGGQSADRTGFASYPRSERIVDQPSSFALGVSGADFGYALIALLCLLLTAFATLRLARRSGASGVGG
jgi:hypothetical protein